MNPRNLHQHRDQGAASLLLLVALAALALLAIPTASTLATSFSTTAARTTGCRSGTPATATAATASIPARYLTLYQAAGARYGIPWTVLAAIGEIESDHGRGPGPGIRSDTNYAGAMGPMQFLAGTWSRYGVDGNHDGQRNVYDPADAIPAAANYLTHSGAPKNLPAALFAYNHSPDYVRAVLAQARRYGHGKLTVAGKACRPARSGTATATPKGSMRDAAATTIAYARAQIGKPYLYGAAGPSAFDCSGLTMKAYQAAGINLPHNAAAQWHTLTHIPQAQAQPGDLIFFTSDGTPQNPGHVGIYLGGHQMIAAPHTGTNVRTESITSGDLVGFARPTRNK